MWHFALIPGAVALLGALQRIPPARGHCAFGGISACRRTRPEDMQQTVLRKRFLSKQCLRQRIEPTANIGQQLTHYPLPLKKQVCDLGVDSGGSRLAVLAI